MIQTRIIPASTATAQEFLVEITERLCKPFCVNSTNSPSATVVFTAGTPTVINGNAVVPIHATTTVVSPAQSACGCAATQVFTESFDVAFTETATNAVTLTPGATVKVTPASIKCCKAHSVKVVATIEVAIA